jgi:hypothetical protein
MTAEAIKPNRDVQTHAPCRYTRRTFSPSERSGGPNVEKIKMMINNIQKSNNGEIFRNMPGIVPHSDGMI